MSPPKYFIAVFGSPGHPGKDTVESGSYHPEPKYAPFGVRIGDVILAYCTASYESCPMQAPGIGIVLKVNNDSLDYRYLPFKIPLPKGKIDKALEATGDQEKFKNIRFSSHWLFEISKKSFLDSAGLQEISWD